MLANKSFGKAVRKFATYILGSNNLCGKLASPLELPIIFNDSLTLFQSHCLLLTDDDNNDNKNEEFFLSYGWTKKGV